MLNTSRSYFQSPESMKYWVHALRYVKAYWAKKQLRETVINEEMDKKLLDQILREEEDEDEENDVSKSFEPQTTFLQWPLAWTDVTV